MAIDDPLNLAEMQAFNVFIAATIHPLYRHFRRPQLIAEGAQAQAALVARVPSLMKSHFQVIETQLSDRRPWIHGEQYSLPDPYLFLFATYLQQSEIENLALFTYINNHRKRTRQRPAVVRTLEREGLSPRW